MIKNYFNIAIRNFIKDSFYSAINVLGLAIGIACSLIISLYILHELSYDDFHPNVEQKYRVNQTNIWDPQGGVMGSSVLPLAGTLLAEYPEVKSALRVNTMGTYTIRAIENNQTEKVFNEPNVLAADSNFFEFFGFELVKGDPKTALQGLNKVVISEEAATKYFGRGNALGKTLYIGESKTPLEVTGIAAQPENSHFNFDFLLSIYTNPAIKQFEWSWIWTQAVTYVELQEGTDPAKLEDKFKNLASTHIAATLQRFNMNYDDFMEGKGDWTFYLQPVKDINLYSGQAGNRLGRVSDIKYIYIFACVAVFVLVLAAINFMNLSTARSSLRAKEIGVRKAIGSSRKQLIIQFLTESILVSAIATIAGLGLMEIIRISIGQLLDVELQSFWSHPLIFVFVFSLPLVLGLAAGIYPAIYLTAFKPANVLKGKLSVGMRSGGFRNTLVVIQFTISIALGICTVVVFQQLNYFSEKHLGFDKENIMVINNAHKLGDQLESFRNELAAHDNVINASIAMDMLGRGTYDEVFTKESDNTRLTLAQLKVDDHFFETMGLELVAGRPFSEDRPSDMRAVLINETAMHLYGWNKDNVLGQRIVYMGDEIGPVEVIGVVKDFNFQSLRTGINPFIFFHTKSTMWGSSRVLALKTKGQHVGELLKVAEQKWQKYAGDNPFEYSFLDEEFENMYRSEETLGSLFSVFSGFALFIASIGLFGLAAYTIHQRSKEIGIRKVLGASISQLVLMLNSNFSKLILISCLLALPLAWYAMTQWLEQFVYKVGIGWPVFVLAGVAALIISWLTVSYQSIKAALVNPVETLKDE
ncbi:ABC transporter permease [Fulvivirga kasyanovii]|uniref:FtsX-like permease family protein n=1 Tax=Fulvivirga kasyanovii TaxID=396812 RepID=A0ABW9RLR0_9BACT|nr:ABC transporter permease [Fulvivirga kasyanovii]MTI25049.1 FtsX-like permease family protein [Fulvivirga kasyanovii]